MTFQYLIEWTQVDGQHENLHRENIWQFGNTFPYPQPLTTAWIIAVTEEVHTNCLVVSEPGLRNRVPPLALSELNMEFLSQEKIRPPSLDVLLMWLLSGVWDLQLVFHDVNPNNDTLIELLHWCPRHCHYLSGKEEVQTHSMFLHHRP